MAVASMPCSLSCDSKLPGSGSCRLSDVGHDMQTAPKRAHRALEGTGEMRDLVADWKKWSSTERLLAMVLVLMLIGLPLRVLIAGAPL
jgi:hypothetical protein